MTRVLVVDDEPQILRTLRISLRARAYDVDVAVDGAAALNTAAKHPPDVVVLDLGLPDMDGVAVIRELRRWTTVPIIVLSGRAGSADKVAALDAGADDYVTKPFGIDELLARIRAATRRGAGARSEPVIARIGRYTVNIADRLVQAEDGETVRLTPTEWRLLEVLARDPGTLHPQRQLLEKVWGPTYRSETNYLRQYMAQLRRKLEDDPAHPQHLITEPGIGYRLRIPSNDSPAARSPEPRR
jgi:two-component system, OmpR family, KDP operon response regulator KdpE